LLTAERLGRSGAAPLRGLVGRFCGEDLAGRFQLAANIEDIGFDFSFHPLKAANISCICAGEGLFWPDEYEAALSQPHARPMVFTGRPMRGFAYVDPLAYRSTRELKGWVQRSLRFVLSLPPK